MTKSPPILCYHCGEDLGFDPVVFDNKNFCCYGLIMPIFIIIIGVLFILRGMNLGIKYVSPKFNKEEPSEVECCH